MGRSSVSREHSCQIKPSGCACSRQREEGGVTHGNDMSVDRKQREKRHRKDHKYATLRWEMKERYPGYVVTEINIIVDVLRGYSLEVRNKMKELFGEKRARECLMKMQKSILSSTLNIARCFKLMSEK